MQEAQVRSVWKKVRDVLSKEMSEVSFKTWIDPMVPLFGDDKTFILSVPDDFSYSYVMPYQPLIANSFSQVLARSIDVQIQVSGSGELLDAMRNMSGSAASQSGAPISFPGISGDSEIVYSQLNPQYSFDSFVVGSGNRFAHAACVAVAEKLGGRNYNPLFLYGGSGLGKTHLMHAIGNYVTRKRKEKKVIYVQCEQFVNEFIAAIKETSYDEFRDKYRSADLLLIDDIQFIEGKEQMQIEFFHTFNALHESGKHIVMTCDKPPQSLASLEERLRTRFSSGLIVDIQPPDYETRYAILQKRAQQNAVQVPEEVLDYIASNIATNIRELDGAFNTVLAYSLLSGALDLEVAVSALKDIILPRPEKTITAQLIMEVVARYYNITVSEILSNRRSKDIIVPRQVAMYLCRYVINMTFPKIGEVFGGKDHTTVIHACNKVSTDLSSSQPDLIADVEEIKKRLSG
ncbi:MAG: chromosomal replication initiator protein DnaA [Clostridiaceae bacterium]|nr:chromosomal replication initiator protein DnaA [Clostridiaceae bacterium]